MVVFGASCDPVEKNVEFAKKLELDFPLLSDTDKSVAKAYGILNDRGMSNRVTFIIGVDGKVAAIESKVTPKSHGDDLVKKLKELKVAPAQRAAES